VPLGRDSAIVGELRISPDAVRDVDPSTGDRLRFTGDAAILGRACFRVAALRMLTRCEGSGERPHTIT